GLEQVRSIGRATQGVRLIKLKADDKLVATEKIVTETAVPQERCETKPGKKVNDSKEKSGTKQKLLSAPKPERKKKSSGKTPKSK
ncbi:MAG: DNA gyrase C-terminal beta-propeller domain-containing protein, partial [Planctomycetota bacterium]